MRKLVNRIGLVTITITIALAAWAMPAHAEEWSFGVMGDTQWTTADPSGQNPDTVPLSFINQVNEQMILAKVKFVIEVGDLTDDGNTPSEAIRAVGAQQLYDAGIGFFPMRGNHETYSFDRQRLRDCRFPDELPPDARPRQHLWRRRLQQPDVCQPRSERHELFV